MASFVKICNNYCKLLHFMSFFRPIVKLAKKIGVFESHVGIFSIFAVILITNNSQI